MSGCAATSAVTLPTGETYTLRHPSGGAIKYSGTDAAGRAVTVEVDGRGKDTMGQILTLMTLQAVRSPELIAK